MNDALRKPLKYLELKASARSRHTLLSCKKDILKSFEQFNDKHLCHMHVACCRPTILLKADTSAGVLLLLLRSFPENFFHRMPSK